MKSRRTLKGAIKELDKHFSLFIRLRDSNENGYGQCVTCGDWRYFKRADNGHFVKRQYKSTRFDERNCALQCKRCNGFEQGRDDVFAEKIKERWGDEVLQSLKLRRDFEKRTPTKLYVFELEGLIARYKRKVKQLLNEKNIKV